MKHVYSGTELRSHGTMPVGGPPPKVPPRIDPDPSGTSTRRLVVLGIAILIVLLLSLALLAAWAWKGRVPEERRFLSGPGGESRTAEAYLWTTKGQMNQLFEFMRNSSFVQGNDLYREMLGPVEFVYEDKNDEVNAYSESRKKWFGTGAPEVRCSSGAARFARLMALAWAVELEGREGTVQRLLGEMGPEQFAVLTEGDAAMLLRAAGLEEALESPSVRSKAESIASGMLSFILAHELGHQALGHVYGAAENHGISRNQEREADSFASNVLETSAFGEYMFVGELFWQYALATQQNGKSGNGTHPEARERMQNLLREHPEFAKAVGLQQDKDN